MGAYFSLSIGSVAGVIPRYVFAQVRGAGLRFTAALTVRTQRGWCFRVGSPVTEIAGSQPPTYATPVGPLGSGHAFRVSVRLGTLD
jgi:hypothetical protein